MTTNINATLPQWPGLEAAMLNVRAHGKATGNEKMIVLNPDGTTRYTYWGDERQVEMQPGDNLAGAMIVHDHPVPGVELSAMDLLFAQAHQTAGIIATMPDGGWSFAEGINLRLPTDYENAMYRFGVPLHPIYKAVDLATAEYERAGDHVVGARRGNRIILNYLAAHGWLRDYRLHLGTEGAQLFSGLAGLHF